MTRYLLPCSCSRRIAVAAGQAGGSVRCPGCGAAVAVPRLGELGRLERDASGPEPADAGRGWNAARACLLGGVVVAVGAAAAAAWRRGWRSAVAPLDQAAVRAAVAAAPVEQVHESWLVYERYGIGRPAVAEEERRVRQAQAIRGLETVAWLTAAAGAAAGVGGAIAAALRRRTTGASA
ncbi:MAG: hypothetical protein ACKON7_06490 [Planctomycetaceae bacterium]